MPAKKTTPSPKPAASTTDGRLIPPRDGAVIRMYRIGHGDCFLIAFDGKTAGKPVYVLIDCGYKPGSPAKIVRTPALAAKDVAADIFKATGGAVDVAVVTHEHQDHVNGFTKTHFSKLKIRQTWFAWTEDPDDPVANALRKTFKDQLLKLLGARNRLAADGNPAEVRWMDQFLAFELGGDSETFDPAAAARILAADGDVSGSSNKISMKLLRDLASEGPRYLKPHGAPIPLPGARNARAFVLGPPSKEKEILDVDPVGIEEFHAFGGSNALAVDDAASTAARSPFNPALGIPLDTITADPEFGGFFRRHYGTSGNTGALPALPGNLSEISSDEASRRIDGEWLESALQLAIKQNNATNNTSLVLAFELGKGGKVLLFAADAQRGNWISWKDGTWKDGDQTITAKDLLGRTVVYKVGHHGSHNATLNGKHTDPHPNLDWMAQGANAREFTALITAVRAWAETQDGWNHPLPAIKTALLKKCSGRVLQTDTHLEDTPATKTDPAFAKRTRGTPLYFDLRIEG